MRNRAPTPLLYAMARYGNCSEALHAVLRDKCSAPGLDAAAREACMAAANVARDAGAVRCASAPTQCHAAGTTTATWYACTGASHAQVVYGLPLRGSPSHAVSELTGGD